MKNEILNEKKQIVIQNARLFGLDPTLSLKSIIWNENINIQTSKKHEETFKGYLQ